MKRKAQMEVMGIAVVVILMLVGLALFVAFMPEPSKLREEFTQSQLATNTAGSILKTTIPECREQIDDLLIDCASVLPTIICSNGKTSCEMVNQTLEIIFNKTLNTFGTAFYFEVNKGLDADGNSNIVLSSASPDIERGCVYVNSATLEREQMDREQSTFPLPTTQGKDLNIVLQVCR